MKNSQTDKKFHFPKYPEKSVVGEGNWNTLGKTTNLLQVTDKLYHMLLYKLCL
jgi:hypothetical protein